MVTDPQLFSASVMHKRFFPRENAFRYKVYYLVLPLPAASIPGRLASFDCKDVGKRDGSDPVHWYRSILSDYKLDDQTQHMLLVTMPRILGYVFNPVSFCLCLDAARDLCAVICEVHNTFGEQHSYICANADHAPITAGQWLEADKVFHVSPFLPRQGNYKFRFDLKGDRLGIWIDYHDGEHQQLMTSLTGKLAPLTAQSLRQAFWQHPLVAMKTIVLIHWQALKLMMKGIGHISKPAQLSAKVTATCNLKKS